MDPMDKMLVLEDQVKALRIECERLDQVITNKNQILVAYEGMIKDLMHLVANVQMDKDYAP